MARFSALLLLVLGGFILLLGVCGVVASLVAAGGVIPGLLALSAVVLLLGFVTLRWALRIMRRTTPLGGVISSSGGRVGAYLMDTTETLELDGSPYTVHYQTPISGKNGRPSSLVLRTQVACEYEFHIRGETRYDRFCKAIGLAVELQTGDPSFDEVCYVRSDSPAFSEAYLSDPIKRVAIVDMRRLGFPDVILNGGYLEARWIGFNPDRHDKPDLAADAGARLVLLSRDLPADQPEFETRTGAWRKQWQFILWCSLILFALTIFSLIPYTPLHFGELLVRSVVPLVLGIPAFAFLSAMLLRGTSRSHTAWGALMIGTIFLLPTGCIGTVGLVNGITDKSPPVSHDALIVRKYTTKSKNSTNYHVECQSWMEPGETDEFGVSHEAYSRVVEGRSKLRVVTQAGGLGVEWMVSKDVLP